MKDRWSDTLHRNIKEVKTRVGCESSPPDGLMKVLSGGSATKTLSGGGMEHFIELLVDGTVNSTKQETNNQEERQTTENGWNRIRSRWRSGSSFVKRTSRSDSKKLFGKSLSKICPDEGSLPKPILKLLVLLRKTGPSTEGVFRRSCNSKKMMEVREQLNSGAEVDLDGQPIVLLVGLLKSFLKELPDSLLVTELYDKWMAAFDNEDVQQRAVGLRSVLDELPRPNILLLQHLLCVLYHIQENADTNKMDAFNLSVCLGPTLLQLDDTPLDEQPEKMKKVADLTQFLIEHWEILGDNIPNLLDIDEDSVSSQHHDSAYDSTDPDGDLENGGSTGETVGEAIKKRGSSSSLTPTNTSWPSEPALLTKPVFDRRCSEPILLLPPEIKSLQCHARSHDDCSVESRRFDGQLLRKQISDDSILIHKPLLAFSKNSTDTLLYDRANRDCSCSSIDSAVSNQSESSVFTNSPTGSPPCLRKAPQTQPASEKTSPEEKKRSQSMRVPLRARSFNRISLKKADPQRENSFPCGTLQEDSQSEAADASSPRPRPLSAMEIFKYVDSRLPCEPPSYQHAVQNAALPPKYRSMTVQDAIHLERRSRPSSVNYDLPTSSSSYSSRHKMDNQTGLDAAERQQTFRQRAMSESVSAGRHEALLRRCSQPVFEEFSYAKESYV